MSGRLCIAALQGRGQLQRILHPRVQRRPHDGETGLLAARGGRTEEEQGEEELHPETDGDQAPGPGGTKQSVADGGVPDVVLFAGDGLHVRRFVLVGGGQVSWVPDGS